MYTPVFSGGLTARRHSALDTRLAALSGQHTAEVHGPETGCGAPDVQEEGDGHVTGHEEHGDEAAAQGVEGVPKHEADVEALVGVSPHTPVRVDGVWLGDDVLKVHLGANRRMSRSGAFHRMRKKHVNDKGKGKVTI